MREQDLVKSETTLTMDRRSFRTVGLKRIVEISIVVAMPRQQTYYITLSDEVVSY